MAIKDVINEFPDTGKLLTINGVDCAGCSVGTCLLKDVLDVHNFPDDTKKTIMAQIDKIINGEKIEIIPAAESPAKSKQDLFCKPIQQLVNEHKNILRLLDLAEYLGNKKQMDKTIKENIEKTIFFVRNYADRFHHAKEENILFIKADPDTEVIKVMLAEHQAGRNFIGLASEGLKSDNRDQIKQSLAGYTELLRNHIRKEDKILYPWFEKILTDDQKKNMQKEFEITDSSFDTHISADLIKFLDDNYS